ncbi:MAG: DNA translocase FtsK 4TM domain-containing protein, partial [Sphingobacteriia bacterium]|nr:DNA translocase FtsK 4TM domain-containing protein [Sphingobacteriia bacterium]
MAIQVNTLKKQAETPEPEKPVEEKSSPKKRKESSTPGKEKEKTTKEKDPVKEERKRRVIGYSLLVLSTYVILAQISYIFTWDADYSQISSVGLWEIINGQTPMKNIMGSVGAAIAHLLIYRGFGISSILITVAIFVVSLRFTFKSIQWKLNKFFRWSTYLLVWSSITFGMVTTNAVDNWSVLGGNFGRVFSDYLETIIGLPGEAMLLLLLLAAFTTITWNIPYRWIKPLWEQYKNKAERDRLEAENNQIRVAEQEGAYNPEEYAVKDEDEDYEEGEIKFYKRSGESDSEPKVNRMNPASNVNQKSEPVNDLDNEIELEVNTSGYNSGNSSKQPASSGDTDLEIVNPGSTNQNNQSLSSSNNEANLGSSELTISENDDAALSELHHTIDEPYDPTLDLPQYQLPATELLMDYGSEEVEVQKDELEANKKRIVETLGNYQITIQKIKATIGPTVTLYEIVPSPGIRISKIKNLEDDIALSLSALGIRIIAPIPGKGTIGIEVPNQNPKIVSMRSMLANEKFTSSKFELPIAIGKTIANEPFITDLAKMPHLLMAGATGQGKSVGLNAIIASL